MPWVENDRTDVFGLNVTFLGISTSLPILIVKNAFAIILDLWYRHSKDIPLGIFSILSAQ